MTCSNSELVSPLTSLYMLDVSLVVVCLAADNELKAVSLSDEGSGIDSRSADSPRVNADG